MNTRHALPMRRLSAVLASMAFAILVSACGPGAGSTEAPGISTPQPGGTQPAEMTPASTAGLGY